MGKYNNCIVMIDDEPSACNFVKSFLEERGYSIYVAFNGEDGIDLIKEKNPILVLLDIRMPGQDGVDVLENIRVHDKELKVVMMTGLEEGERLESAEKLGVAGILNKPVQLLELSKTICSYIPQP
ncbi:MAG: response regulator [Candidatus Omnitrophota bacterium]